MASIQNMSLTKKYIVQYANQRAGHYQKLISKRAQQLGIPNLAIGLEMTRGQIFNPNSIQGGSLDQFGIEVDAGIFVPKCMGPNVLSWSQGSIADRIDAVLVHEYVEHQFAVAAGTNWDIEVSHNLALTLDPIMVERWEY